MLVFDFDGVIADSLATCTQACSHSAIKFGHKSPLPDNPFANLNQVSFEGLAGKLGLAPAEFATETCRYLEQKNDISPMFAGMGGVLQRLSVGHSICILSASPWKTIDRFLQFHGCSKYISQIISRDIPGGKREKLMKLQREAAGQISCMIGDGTSDIAAAKEAHVFSIGVTWGWQEADMLRRAGADFIVDTPVQIENCLEHPMRG